MAKIITPWKFQIKKETKHIFSFLKEDLIYFQRLQFQDGTTKTKFNIHPILWWGGLIALALFIYFI